MNPAYPLSNIDTVFTPALVFYRDLIQKNIAEVIRLAGSADRLCPHVKTHKTREIAQLELEAGITSHKCATIAEAEMLAQCGAPDIILAYPVVGPNAVRLAELAQKYPQLQFSTVTDHPAAAKHLSETWTKIHGTEKKLHVLIDLDVGQHRTGIPAGPDAETLYKLVASLPGLQVDGFHVYDGHNHQESLQDRQAAVDALFAPVLVMRKNLEAEGYAVPRLICGGTPTFPIWAKMHYPGLQCSPGTFVLYDHGYGSKYPELSGLTPAAILVTRVISRPSPTRITMDLGYKAVASDPPAGKRMFLLDFPECTPVLQNEEHFAVETPTENNFQPGDIVYAIPTHICPTCAMHQRAYVAEDNQIKTTWNIVGRDRFLTL